MTNERQQLFDRIRSALGECGALDSVVAQMSLDGGADFEVSGLTVEDLEQAFFRESSCADEHLLFFISELLAYYFANRDANTVEQKAGWLVASIISGDLIQQDKQDLEFEITKIIPLLCDVSGELSDSLMADLVVELFGTLKR